MTTSGWIACVIAGFASFGLVRLWAYSTSKLLRSNADLTQALKKSGDDVSKMRTDFLLKTHELERRIAVLEAERYQNPNVAPSIPPFWVWVSDGTKKERFLLG